MANNYTKILELANKNNMGLSNTIKRDYGIPLDYSSVQETYEAALAYAQSSTLAYVGQPISVGDTLYIVTGEAGDKALKAVGTKPVGDNTSIEVTEAGVVSIKGFSAAASSTLPRKRADGSVEWVTIDAIVADDRNTKTVVTAVDGSDITVTPSYDDKTDTYTYTLDVQFPAIPAYTVTKTAGEGVITYQLTKDGVAEGEAIVVPNAYNDSALAGRVSTLEAGAENHESRLAGVEGKVDTFFAAVEEPDEIINTLAEIQKYIADDKTGAAGMLEDIGANTTAIETLNGTGTGSVAKTVADAVAAQAVIDAGKYALQSDLESVSAKADAAAVKTEVETALNDKADKTSLSNYYTKEESYSKSDIDAFLEDLEEAAGETAGGVAQDLAEHVADNEAKFEAIDKKDAAQDGLIQTNADEIAAINNETTGIYARAIASAATTAQTKVDALANGTVAANSAAIEAINTQISGINSNYSTLSGDVAGLKTTSGQLDAAIKAETTAREAVEKTVASHTTSITGLTSKDTELAAAIEANTAKFDEYSKTTEVEKKIKDAIDGISNAALEEAIAANTKAIDEETKRATAKENELAELIGANDKAIKANAASIEALEATLNAAIENEDSTALDSIKELATWIAEHDDPENGVLKAVNDNTAAIEKLNGTGDGSVQKTVADAIANIPATPVATTTTAGIVKASADIAVTSDGTMVINDGVFNTDRLVQGSNTLVLNGGTANVPAITE